MRLAMSCCSMMETMRRSGGASGALGAKGNLGQQTQ